MLLPVALVMGTLIGYPLVRGVILSFTDADRFTIGNAFVPASYQYVGVRNYSDILRNSEFRRVAGFTAVWTFANVFFHFTIGLALALALNRPMRFRGAYRLLLMVPWAVPTFISAFAWRFIFNNPYGFLDQLLGKLGRAEAPAFLGDPTWAQLSVIMTNVWIGVPFTMLALLGGLQAIDGDLLDAAAVDGASALRRFWDVTLPGLRPVAATVILLGLIWTFNAFNIIFLITAGGPGNATQILTTFAYRAAFTDFLYGQAAAYGVILLSMLLVFGTLYRRTVARMGEETWA
ncbi:MAG: sugar ABC transporter permease [Gaiellaceae bacterium MAG52_C11]|nr:sugar ABC transporter permease [Candidatus Gaiellasilicea maunaloa]